MLTKARELSGAEDRHNGRKEAGNRKGGSHFSLTKSPLFRPRRCILISNIGTDVRTNNLPCYRDQRRDHTHRRRGWMVADFGPSFSLTPQAFTPTTWRLDGGAGKSAAWREGMRERAVHCANREGREGRTGLVPLLCVCRRCVYNTSAVTSFTYLSMKERSSRLFIKHLLYSRWCEPGRHWTYKKKKKTKTNLVNNKYYKIILKCYHFIPVA